MATVYTYKVRNGEISSFKEFVLECAEHGRKSIAYLHQSCEYHENEIRARADEVKRIGALSAEQRQAEADAAEIEARAFAEQRRQEDADGARRYDLMLAHARNWVPPTPEHQKLKEFMVSQLEMSLDDTPSQPGHRITREDGQSWMWRRIGELSEKIAYHTGKLASTREQIAAEIAWYDSVAASV